MDTNLVEASVLGSIRHIAIVEGEGAIPFDDTL